jgi:hypothetical protein
MHGEAASPGRSDGRGSRVVQAVEQHNRHAATAAGYASLGGSRSVLGAAWRRRPRSGRSGPGDLLVATGRVPGVLKRWARSTDGTSARIEPSHCRRSQRPSHRCTPRRGFASEGPWRNDHHPKHIDHAAYGVTRTELPAHVATRSTPTSRAASQASARSRLALTFAFTGVPSRLAGPWPETNRRLRVRTAMR